MTSAILVDENLFTQKGLVKLTVNRTFQMNITADEARSHVHGWLVDEVSSNIGAEMPTLVLADRPMWRVPAWLSFPRYGHVGAVGAVDVDVETRKIQNPIQCKAEIAHCAEELAQRLPTYQPRHRTPSAPSPTVIPTVIPTVTR
jgi:hypothetical protein